LDKTFSFSSKQNVLFILFWWVVRLQVEGTDADRGTVLITLALGGESVTKSQVAVTVVSEEEYKKESKVISG
jgi:hypothetical protein